MFLQPNKQLGEELYEVKVSRTVLKTSPLWRHRGLSLTMKNAPQFEQDYAGFKDGQDFFMMSSLLIY